MILPDSILKTYRSKLSQEHLNVFGINTFNVLMLRTFI
ncbi:hypothetical protein A6A12_0073 [Vibrio anguillarum]|nr:hypothetical protein A6A12_2834 [Vibrio anguillarum]ARV26375.1 hypothetical protein A6A12_2730 [Vibrio anguillarum]ARV27235.1 hypothetical protein A6A12_2924 [Vibrio anguillarum]ARV27330.1 hypothetical protein A6A12_2247 [Vibrio anguillarum]ARV28004.1 hypothetical protein A6A12_2997 [Vibrio anguillarum]